MNTAALELEDDEIVEGDREADGGLALALSILHRMVESAQVHEGAQGLHPKPSTLNPKP